MIPKIIVRMRAATVITRDHREALFWGSWRRLRRWRRSPADFNGRAHGRRHRHGMPRHYRSAGGRSTMVAEGRLNHLHSSSIRGIKLMHLSIQQCLLSVARSWRLSLNSWRNQSFRMKWRNDLLLFLWYRHNRAFSWKQTNCFLAWWQHAL